MDIYGTYNYSSHGVHYKSIWIFPGLDVLDLLLMCFSSLPALQVLGRRF